MRIASVDLSGVGMICAILLLSPVHSLNQLRFIACLVLTMWGSEIVFIATFFSAAHLFVQTHQLVRTDVIAVDDVLDPLLYIFGVIRTSTKCGCPSLRIIFPEVLIDIIVITVMENTFSSTSNHTTALVKNRRRSDFRYTQI
ncbi:hypothetical protein BLNAU_12825 [Blattamonas nauphoetae]|uniref:Uncharacterized protein n=1 Tax=Blattamonas nauphoetae TaxID=2049346 RepID=A0ABQ9XIK7_9EUKA|nr:hypothetical protein BLNAU_12825 [Blattamonas nauphoetae]